MALMTPHNCHNFWTSLNKTGHSETLSFKHIMMCALTKCFTALIFDALLFNGFSHDLLTKKKAKKPGHLFFDKTSNCLVLQNR